MLDRLREWWERLGPRERGLMRLLGATGVLIVLIYIGFTIRDGLNDLEDRNDAMHAALKNLEEHREDLQPGHNRRADITTLIPDEAHPLATYLEEREKEAGVKINTQADKQPVVKGKFRELALQINLVDVTVDQLAHFLKSIETNSPTVVTQRLYVKRSSMHKDKIDRVEITVSTYERGKGQKGQKGEGDKAEARAHEDAGAGANE